MIRRFVLVLLCGALAVSVSVGAAVAQDRDRAPQELWDQFPLEPTPTPAAAAPTATPTPDVVRVESDEGMSTGVLIALVLVAGALGGLAARLASRRMPRKRAASPARTTNGTPAAPRAASLPPQVAEPLRVRATPAPGARTEIEPPETTQAAGRESRPQQKREPTPAARRESQPQQKREPTPTARRESQPEQKRQATPTAPSKRDPEQPREATPAARHESQPQQKREPMPTAPSKAEPQQPRHPAPAAPTKPERKQKRAAARTTRAVARDTGAPPAPRTPPPAQRPPAPQRPRPASPPAVPPQPPRARRFEPAGASWEACAIKLQTRGIHGRFCAISAGEPSVLAYSPTFPLKRDKSAPGLTAPAALKMLVEQLAASGWRQTDVGEKPWELAFRRRIEHERPVRS